MAGMEPAMRRRQATRRSPAAIEVVNRPKKRHGSRR
jgi:hypothetical protein